SSESRAAIRALLSAFSDGRDALDRFSLYDARHPEAPAVAPERFEYGRVAVALEKMVAGESVARTAEVIQAAKKDLVDPHAEDDARPPLGASGTIVLAARSLAEDTAAIEAAARSSA